MQVKFRTAQPMDFTNVRYVIAFNTSGTGGTPYPLYCNASNNWRDCYFQFIVGGNGSSATAQLIQFFRQPGPNNTVSVSIQNLPFTPQDVILTTNSNSQQTEFTLTFNRALLYGLTPSGATAPPTTAAQVNWQMNFFTTDTSGTILDTPGFNGANDVTFSFSVDVTQPFDTQFTSPPGATQAANQAAQITSGEVINNP
ncbi:MAG: hypothetical protein JO165_02165 [Candidatus Eremiobacteraeota bacterium]|nr:hypothetical protein [Candidatus Eremiobacteraeota bacterium]